MDNQPNTEPETLDPMRIGGTMTDIAERSQRLVLDFLTRQGNGQTGAPNDPLNIGQAFLEMTTRMVSDPTRLMEANMSLWQDYMSLWQSTAQRMMGVETEAVAAPDGDDRRFKDAVWSENEVFDYIKQSYLLTSRWMQSTVGDVEGLDDATAKKVDFFTRQFTEALSPTNFAMTNPEVLRATAESGGENLLNGLQNLLEDLEDGNGKLNIKMVDKEAFEVGVNVATTPGKVVYRNDLMELIQYEPATDKVSPVPLVIVPPWINKFYILDLRAKNSFIKWAVDQGHTVFIVSWVNPDADLAAKTFDDYMLEGPLAAFDVAAEITGQEQVNAIGYCIGGTLVGSALAYMAAKGIDRVKSATFFTTMLDFAEAGELGVFIDEEALQNLEAKMNERGYLEGRDMATTFNMMRGNDLIWSFVVNNYLLGKEPFPFDLLYWNSDSTRMPAAMHSFYLRNMYLDNKLKDKGGVTLDGVAIDLGTVKVPTYAIATKEDHIAPWKSSFAITKLFSGPVRFVLSASGHIAGVVNPPVAEKYCHWTNTKKAETPDAWLDGAKQADGSWWPDWDKWAKKHAGKPSVKARKPGSAKFKPLADAPGEYVRVQAED